MKENPIQNLEYDKKVGSLIGLMVGDALGTTLEFSVRNKNSHHTDIIGGGPFRLNAGYFTDDTSMALALADSLETCNAFNPKDLMDRFLNWKINGAYSPTNTCFDIGGTTSAALEKYSRTGNPYSGSTHPKTAGNGSLMRVAPIAVKFCYDQKLAIENAALQSRTTHGADECIAACEFYTLLLCEAFKGNSKNEIFNRKYFSNIKKVTDISNGIYKSKAIHEISSSGYVIDTLEAALWSIYKTNNFEDALILAVNLGDDADTVGAVTGQLAGAIYGYMSIPQRWLAKLSQKWVKKFEKFTKSTL